MTAQITHPSSGASRMCYGKLRLVGSNCISMTKPRLVTSCLLKPAIVRRRTIEMVVDSPFRWRVRNRWFFGRTGCEGDAS